MARQGEFTARHLLPLTVGKATTTTSTVPIKPPGTFLALRRAAAPALLTQDGVRLSRLLRPALAAFLVVPARH